MTVRGRGGGQTRRAFYSNSSHSRVPRPLCTGQASWAQAARSQGTAGGGRAGRGLGGSSLPLCSGSHVLGGGGGRLPAQPSSERLPLSLVMSGCDPDPVRCPGPGGCCPQLGWVLTTGWQWTRSLGLGDKSDAWPWGEDRSPGALQLLAVPTTKGQRAVNRLRMGPCSA